jgi:hypothetical protein
MPLPFPINALPLRLPGVNKITGMKTAKIFGTLVLIVIVQELVNRLLQGYFSLGWFPVLIFGTLWNLRNGERIYSSLSLKIGFNLKTFVSISLCVVVYFVVFDILLNIFNPDVKEGVEFTTYPFATISMISAFPLLFAYWYNIDFVSRGLARYYQRESWRGWAILSLIFYPCGIWWIQPKVDNIKPAAQNWASRSRST